METKANNNEDPVYAGSFLKESINWNRIATIIATVVVLFFFTRSAPFPSNIFWELAIARDFDLSLGWVIFPETLTFNIVNSGYFSLIGLKAIFHIIYFVLCSTICVWIFKNREPLPGLIGLSVFAFTMHVFLDLRLLLTMIFILGLLSLLDNDRMKGSIGVILIPVMASASGFGLNTILLMALVMSYVFCNKNYSFTLIFCAVIGGLFFPEGLVAALDKTSLLNMNFLTDADMETLYLLGGIFLLVNIMFLGRLTRADLPVLVFYAVTGFGSLIYPGSVAIFVFMGLFMMIKLFADQQPLGLNYQMGGLLIITFMVYLYLFVYPYGIKLNPSVKNQLGKDLTPITEGYIDQMPIERYHLGELAWKGMITLDQYKIRNNLIEEELTLLRVRNDEYKVVPRKATAPVEETEIEF